MTEISCHEIPLQLVDGADRDALRIEDRTLFDMQFDEGVRRHESRSCLAAIADAGEFGAERRTIDRRGGIGVVERKPAGMDEAPEHVRLEARAFFVREEGHGERARRREAGIAQGFDHLEPGEDAVIAVIAAAGPHRVDM